MIIIIVLVDAVIPTEYNLLATVVSLIIVFVSIHSTDLATSMGRCFIWKNHNYILTSHSNRSSLLVGI